MKPPDSLVAGLINSNFLPNNPIELGSYAQLEAALVDHFFSCNKNSKSLSFDCECIECEDSYAFLLEGFIGILPDDLKIEEIESHFDRDKGTAYCRFKIDSQVYFKEWNQDSDWVSSEFRELIFAAINDAYGRLVELAVGDQTTLVIYLDRELGALYEQYISDDSRSRESYLTGYSEGHRIYFSDIKILPLSKYDEIFSLFKRRFLSGNNALDPSNYQEEIIYLSTTPYLDDAFKMYSELYKCNEPDVYIKKDSSKYFSILPDQECYYLGLSQSDNRPIFRYKAHNLEGVFGKIEFGFEVGDYMLLGLDCDWGLVNTGRNIICFGFDAIEKFRPFIIRTKDNGLAAAWNNYIEKQFKKVMRAHALVEIASRNEYLAYESPASDFCWQFILKTKQRNIEDGLQISIELRCANQRVTKYFEDDTNKFRNNYFPYERKDWNISTIEELSRCTANIEEHIELLFVKESKGLSMSICFQMYAENRMYEHACVASYLDDDLKEAEKQLGIQVDIEAKSYRGLEPNSYTIKLAEKLGLDINKVKG